MIRLPIVLLLAAGAAAAAPSAKRGVCAKDLTAADWAALSPGVSWWYNWHFEPDTAVPAGGPEFVPMLWGDHPDSWKGLERSFTARPHPRAILVINEPNLKSQANMTPAATATAWRRAKRLGDRRKIPVVGPQLAIGCAAADCIAPEFTWMVPFIDAFRKRLPKGARPVLAIHPYGNIGELKWAVGEARKQSGGPVWVTEFNEWKAADESAAVAYMTEAVAFMEASPDVAGYAWFMARIKDAPTHSLLADEPGRLTRLGATYVSLPGAPAGGSPLRP